MLTVICSAESGGIRLLRSSPLQAESPVRTSSRAASSRGFPAFERISAISGLSAVKPQGAFYILINVSQLGLKSQNFADRLLSKANVAVVPGIAFGDDQTVRISYATSLDVIKNGLDRIEEFCKTL